MNRVPLAAADLFADWMMHDLEELATVSKPSRNLVTRLPDRVPGPVRVRDQGLTNRHIAADIATVGTVIAAATVRGHRHRAGQPSTRTLEPALNALLRPSTDGLRPDQVVGRSPPVVC